MNCWRSGAGAVLLLAAAWAGAQPLQVVDIPTRPGVTERLGIVQPAQASAVVILLAGGEGRLGLDEGGKIERSGNFLIRSRERFAQRGLVAVLLDTPSDHSQPPFLAGDFRQSAEHMADLAAAVRWARTKFALPVWLVGTSRGTHSAAEAAHALQGADAPDGIVLTSTILAGGGRETTARPVTEIDLSRAALPVLVAHHQRDACQVCDPVLLPALMQRLPAGRSELLTYTGGLSLGPECGARAHHGFNGIEDRVVADIAAWIAARK